MWLERSTNSTVLFGIPNPSLTLRTTSASPNGGAIYEMPDQYSWPSRSSETRKLAEKTERAVVMPWNGKRQWAHICSSPVGREARATEWAWSQPALSETEPPKTKKRKEQRQALATAKAEGRLVWGNRKLAKLRQSQESRPSTALMLVPWLRQTLIMGKLSREYRALLIQLLCKSKISS